MSTIDTTGFSITPLSEIKDRLSEAKYDPTLLIQASLETIEGLGNGAIYLVDPTHPAVNVLEMAAVMAANNLQEGISNLRKQYPIIAADVDDLYRHMSDIDFLNRFASASVADFVFILSLDDLFNKLIFDSVELCYKAVIPRDTKIVVDGVSFTLLYPIVIRRYENGVVQVSYDATVSNPVYDLKSNLIETNVRTATTGEQWLFFTFQALQVNIATTYYDVDMTINFKKEISYSDDFYYVRGFYKNNNTGAKWVELKTTHTDQVFSTTTPTLVLKVNEENKTVQVEIPIFYLTTGMLRGELRVDVYTTHGVINMNLGTYGQDLYSVQMQPIDEDRDSSDYSRLFGEMSYHVTSNYVVSSSKPALSYQDLRNRVLYNATGPQVIPITNAQLTANAVNNGFEIAQNIDVLTNRVYLATRRLPTPKNEKLITAANIGNATIASTLGDLTSNEYVAVNGQRVTIKSKTVIKNNNGKLRLLRQAEMNQITAMTQPAMVRELNTGRYYYSPFYYVLDIKEDTFETRAYSLDLPYAKDLDFVQQNQSLQLLVNIASYSLVKIPSGFQLDVVTVSGTNYKALEDGQVGIQLAINPEGETTYAYVDGVMIGKTSSNERIFRFTLTTNYDFNENDQLALTNPVINEMPGYKTFVALEKTVSLIHYTTSVNAGFIPDSTDLILGKFALPNNAVANTLEKLTCHFGDALTRLWKRSRAYQNDVVYRRHNVDVPSVWTTNVRAIDPVSQRDFTIDGNGQIVFSYEHQIGDPVLDDQGNPVYKYRAGDVVLDQDGNPVVDTVISEGREFDILITDGRYLFSDDEATVDYRDEIEKTLVDWIVDDIALLAPNLLDQTKIYFFPKTTLGDISVNIENSGTDELEAEQLFKLELYVRGSIYRDLDLREKLRRITVKTLDSAISEAVINMTVIRDMLKTAYGDSVVAFTIRGLGGDKNYEVMSVASEWKRFCLKKLLVIKPDRKMLVEDAVEIDFKLSV